MTGRYVELGPQSRRHVSLKPQSEKSPDAFTAIQIDSNKTSPTSKKWPRDQKSRFSQVSASLKTEPRSSPRQRTSSLSDKSSAWNRRNQIRRRRLGARGRFFVRMGTIRPAALQWCRSPYFLLFAIAFLTAAQAFGIRGVFPTAARYLQIKFYPKTFDLGIIRMMCDVGHFVALLPVMYFGYSGANRPIWIGAGAMAMGIGSIIVVLPQFIASEYKIVFPINDVCRPNSIGLPKASETCEYAPMAQSKYIFMVGSFLYGMGAAPALSMGLTYLDENISRRMSTIFSGVLLVFSLLGTFLGYVVVSGMSRIWGDINRDSSTDVISGPDDLRWYGMWWVAMIISAFLVWLAGIVIAGFPFQLPGARKARPADAKRRFAFIVQQDRLEKDEKIDVATVRSVLKRCLVVLCSPYYIGLVLDVCSSQFLVNAFASFMPHYFLHVFHIPMYEIQKYAAPAYAVAILSVLAGILIQHLFYLRVVGNIRFSLIAAIASLLFMGAFFIQCRHLVRIVGVTDPYLNSSGLSLSSSCNNNCSCGDVLDPVCYSPPGKGKQLSFFSRCHAGCTGNMVGNKVGDCKCVPNNGSVTIGYYVPNCGKTFYAFLVAFSWAIVSLYIRMNAVEQGILRCVPFDLRVISVAMAEAISKLVGHIPAPPAFGYLLQQSCRQWQRDCENHKAICSVYDEEKLTQKVGLMAYALTLASILGLLMAVIGTRNRLFDPSTGASTSKDSKKRALKKAEGQQRSESQKTGSNRNRSGGSQKPSAKSQKSSRKSSKQ